MSEERIASQAYLEVAAAHGVEYIFGLPGTSGQEFIGTIADQEKIRFILAMHETCVVSMADGHARVTGRPQLAQVSTLPGSANSVGALYDAYRDRSPVIVTSTNVDTRIDGRDSHTEAKNLGRDDQAVHQVERRSSSRRPDSGIFEPRIQSRIVGAHRAGVSRAAE